VVEMFNAASCVRRKGIWMRLRGSWWLRLGSFFLHQKAKKQGKQAQIPSFCRLFASRLTCPDTHASYHPQFFNENICVDKCLSANAWRLK
jgi:hypothetical protein